MFKEVVHTSVRRPVASAPQKAASSGPKGKTSVLAKASLTTTPAATATSAATSLLAALARPHRVNDLHYLAFAILSVIVKMPTAALLELFLIKNMVYECDLDHLTTLDITSL